MSDGKFDWLATICFECANAYLYGLSATQTHCIIGWKDSDLDRCLRTLLASE